VLLDIFSLCVYHSYDIIQERWKRRGKQQNYCIQKPEMESFFFLKKKRKEKSQGTGIEG